MVEHFVPTAGSTSWDPGRVGGATPFTGAAAPGEPPPEGTPASAAEEGGGLMPSTSSAPPHGPPRVIWSLQAQLDLELVVEDPAVQQQLKDNAEETLHETADHSA